MSSVDGEQLDNDSSFRNYNLILTPLMIFIAIGFICIVLHLHRSRRLRQRYAHWPPPSHPTATVHILRPGGAAAGGPAAAAGGQRSGGRWLWGTSRADEGLNELGEAPPPYDPKKNEAVELGDLERGNRPPEYQAGGSSVTEPPRAVTTDRETERGMRYQ